LLGKYNSIFFKWSSVFFSLFLSLPSFLQFDTNEYDVIFIRKDRCIRFGLRDWHCSHKSSSSRLGVANNWSRHIFHFTWQAGWCHQHGTQDTIVWRVSVPVPGTAAETFACARTWCHLLVRSFYLFICTLSFFLHFLFQFSFLIFSFCLFSAGEKYKFDDSPPGLWLFN
jgi:hypothetical protein